MVSFPWERMESSKSQLLALTFNCLNIVNIFPVVSCRLSGFVFLIFNKAVKSRSLLTSITILCLSCNAYKILFMKMGFSENTTELRSNCKRKTLGIDAQLYCFKQNCLEDLSPFS